MIVPPKVLAQRETNHSHPRYSRNNNHNHAKVVDATGVALPRPRLTTKVSVVSSRRSRFVDVTPLDWPDSISMILEHPRQETANGKQVVMAIFPDEGAWPTPPLSL